MSEGEASSLLPTHEAKLECDLTLTINLPDLTLLMPGELQKWGHCDPYRREEKSQASGIGILSSTELVGGNLIVSV